MNLSLPGIFLKNQNMHAYIYKMNLLVGLSCWIIYEVIILSESKKDSLNVCYPFLHLLWQSRHSLSTVVPSSADLTCFVIENILLLPHLKQMYNEFSRASCGFSRCLITRFNLSLAESKAGCSKSGSIFFQLLDKQKAT